MAKTPKAPNPHVGSAFQKELSSRTRRDPAFAAAFAEAFDKAELARQLRAARERRSLTQAALAKLIGTTQSVVARLESGRTLPRLDMLTRVGEALGVRVRVAFEDVDAVTT